MKLCNMTIEAGSRTGLVALDDTTFGWLEGRPLVPRGRSWETALACRRGLRSDDGAVFSHILEVDATQLAP